MKALFITEFFPSSTGIDIHGGVEARTYQIASRMQEAAAVIASYEENKPARQTISGVAVQRVGLGRKYSRTGELLGRLSFMIAAFIHGLFIKCDLIEASSFFAWLPAYMLARIKRCKCVLVVADTVEAYAVDTNILVISLLKWYERLCFGFKWDSIIVISNTVKKKLLQKKVPGNNLKVIYCGVAYHRLKTLKVKKNQIPTICCIARLVPYKRVQDVVEATALLLRNNTKVRLDIIGNGEEEGRLKQLVALKKMDHRVSFHSHLPQQIMVWRLLKKSHLFCLPSLVEGFGIVTVEALAAEVPAVLPELPIHHEVTEGKGVVFYRGRDHRDLASKLQQLLKNRKLYQRLKKQTAGVAQKYQWEGIFRQTHNLYEHLFTD